MLKVTEDSPAPTAKKAIVEDIIIKLDRMGRTEYIGCCLSRDFGVKVA